RYQVETISLILDIIWKQKINFIANLIITKKEFNSQLNVCIYALSSFVFGIFSSFIFFWIFFFFFSTCLSYLTYPESTLNLFRFIRNNKGTWIDFINIFIQFQFTFSWR